MFSKRGNVNRKTLNKNIVIWVQPKFLSIRTLLQLLITKTVASIIKFYPYFASVIQHHYFLTIIDYLIILKELLYTLFYKISVMLSVFFFLKRKID